MRRRTVGRSLICSMLIGLVGLGSSHLATADDELTFDQWRDTCLEAPSNRVLRGRVPAKADLPLPSFETVEATATRLLKQFQQSDLSSDSRWLNTPPGQPFFDVDRHYFRKPPIPFQPFTQKLELPAGSKIIFHGDLHGDIRSLMTTLEWLNEKEVLDGFRIKSPDTHMIFLGDYVDRGSYGVEVLYTLMRLKLANPTQVWMVRGNHEDFEMTARYGFLREGQLKYGRDFNPLSLWRMYDFLPVVLYVGVGNDFFQCNHGGMEPGYDPHSLLAAEGSPRYQLLGELKQKTFAKEHPEWSQDADPATRAMLDEKLHDFVPRSPLDPHPIGFMWNDFLVSSTEPMIGFNEARLAFNHGQASTQYLLRRASSQNTQLRAVFRAHQHSSVPSPAMNRILASNGAFRHWQATDDGRNAKLEELRRFLDQQPARRIPDGSVWTFNVSPDSVYGAGNNYRFDTIGVLATAEAFDDWRLNVVNIPVSTDD